MQMDEVEQSYLESNFDEQREARQSEVHLTGTPGFGGTNEEEY